MGEKIALKSCVAVGCHGGCIHKTHVKDGKIDKVERLIYPDGEKGTICRKGVAGARFPYLNDRLRYPLKRAGRRGEGKWERITWEQALDEIAEKIKKIREEYKPESVAIMAWGNSVSPANGIQTRLLGSRFQNLLQATNFVNGWPIDSNIAFASYFSYGTSYATTMDPRTLLEGNTQYMIAWGINPAETAPRFWEQISKARKKGAKFVDIGVMFDDTAKRADWWIPVNVGSDAALCLAMINIIINERLYDEEYVTKYTNGPFLVRMDNGKFLRERDLSSTGDPQKYIVWDEERHQPKAIAPGTYEFSGYKPALLGTYGPGGVDCKPAFQLLADLANNYLPEKAEEITGVSPENIERLAREYATIKPAAILQNCGMRYGNSGNVYRVLNALGAITGNTGMMGGGSVMGHFTAAGSNAPQLRLNEGPIIFPTEARSRTIPSAEAFQCMITGRPYPIKALVSYHNLCPYLSQSSKMD